MIDFTQYPRKENTAYIYALIDPRADEIRYVGQTANLKRRYSRHITDAKRGTEWYVSRWVRLLLSFDLVPLIEMLEEIPANDWQWYEIWWIAYGKIIGWRLTNATLGGDGLSGYVQSKETRRKKSEAMRGKQNNLGHKDTEETKRRKSEALKGHKHTEESLLKMSEAKRGEKGSAVKLVESYVHEIRKMIRDGETNKEIAGMYGVSRTTINDIRRGKSWKWLK